MIFAAFIRTVTDVDFRSMISTSFHIARRWLTLLRLPLRRPFGLPLVPFLN